MGPRNSSASRARSPERRTHNSEFDLAVVLLNFCTAELTLDCLASLEGEIDDGSTVVVVDNASGDGSVERIERHIVDKGWSGWARVLPSPYNGGFAWGNNLGIRGTDADVYVLLNSDTVVRPGAIRALRAALQDRPEAGIVGPSIENGDGDLEISHHRNITPISELLRAAATAPLTWLLRRFAIDWPERAQPCEPEWIGFACVAVRRQVIEDVGLLDEGYFMYFEDVDYCRRARAAGWGVLYWPEARVLHYNGASSGLSFQLADTRRRPRYYYESRARYFSRYYGTLGLWAANALWLLGRSIRIGRAVAARRTAPSRAGEARDIWIDAGRQLPRSRSRG